MSQIEPAPADPQRESLSATSQKQYQQTMQALGKFVERITPWLLEVGIWIFGGLIAFTVLVMASLLTVGPVDPAILVATTAFALALPLNVIGLILLRLIQDVKQVRFEEEMAQAFQEVGFTGDPQIPAPPALEELRLRRTRTILVYCFGILALSALLTLTGMIAALWHMAWWIGVSFCAMVILSLVIVILANSTSQPPTQRSARDASGQNR